jgi:hypothetical protein
MFRLIPLSVLVMAGLLNVAVWQEVGAAPVTSAVQHRMTAMGNGLVQNVYYTYRGRKYKYRYKGGYYNHRAYRNGRWRYY